MHCNSFETGKFDAMSTFHKMPASALIWGAISHVLNSWTRISRDQIQEYPSSEVVKVLLLFRIRVMRSGFFKVWQKSVTQPIPWQTDGLCKRGRETRSASRRRISVAKGRRRRIIWLAELARLQDGRAGWLLGILAQHFFSTGILRWRYLWIKCGVDSRTRARTERGNTRSGATKKREISRNLLSRNLHCSVQFNHLQCDTMRRIHTACC